MTKEWTPEAAADTHGEQWRIVSSVRSASAQAHWRSAEPCRTLEALPILIVVEHNELEPWRELRLCRLTPRQGIKARAHAPLVTGHALRVPVVGAQAPADRTWGRIVERGTERDDQITQHFVPTERVLRGVEVAV
eukprot:CAMPEP_0181221716 /NCGR_PEP_ID=MMETSP1096-20121128/29564_1 /TAXON_ID=156174 ORGANISM="Chrysochromulina ericina, Strain CCMP281" /NCGR_SAMPLE_ID=MMETSP1096 /ASSEMBLY_ACC=CAM_ASM_000453 /LENGTH=134 /DNA_ID=CAMNT_0023314395 /DNA_START=74 /DNA_END=479 /DNA_ORIENTATION=-